MALRGTRGAWVGLLAFGLTACGSSEEAGTVPSLTCGPGTVASGGMCVPVGETDSGADAAKEETGTVDGAADGNSDGNTDASGDSGGQPSVEDMPERVKVEGGTAMVPTGTTIDGFMWGGIPMSNPVSTFVITRFPITQRQYQKCVAAGACSPQALTIFYCTPSFVEREGKRENLPVQCETHQQAEAYCKWVGGRLPEMWEWYWAAFGGKDAFYWWGSTPASCAQNPRAMETTYDYSADKCCPQGKTSEFCGEDHYDIGSHPMSKNPRGVEDILLTPAERSSHAKLGQVLVVGKKGDAYGIVDHEQNYGALGFAASFRCVWEVKP